MGKGKYIVYFIKNAPGAIRERLFHKSKSCLRFRGQKNITLEYSNEVLKEFISSGKPFAAIHFGGMEMTCINNYEKILLRFRKDFKPGVKYVMKNNTGFYPADDEHLMEYGRRWIEECSSADLLGIMGLHMEDYFAGKYMKNAKVAQYEAFEPCHGDWVSLLKGKKVLVVSPFEEEIKNQYAKRELLFEGDPNRLPEFDLQVVKSPLTLGDEVGEEATFFDGLKKMEDEISKLDFDIALVGCGSYGSFLCAYIKGLGKQAIQTGGATQTLFGIMGKRWENREHVSKWFNEHWIRPYAKASGSNRIDKGAYW
ncbi:MAG: hypothetical protein MJ239_03725 [Bacilli bacterium]|nr:hypothetical protein [Bacilli bacterium]